MYCAPQCFDAQVFASIPDRYPVQGRRNRWIDVQRGGVPTDCFLEGPSFDRDGNLYVVDVAWGRIFRISPTAEVELFLDTTANPTA